MKKKISNPSDLVADTVYLLAEVGVVKIDWADLESALHGTVGAQNLVDHAHELYAESKRQITFDQLMQSWRASHD